MSYVRSAATQCSPKTRKNLAPTPPEILDQHCNELFPFAIRATITAAITTVTTTSKALARLSRTSNNPVLETSRSPFSHATMTGRGGGGGRRVLLPPINMIFKLLQSHATVSVWLYEQLGIRIEGKIRGFDEFMNLVLDEAVEVSQVTKTNDKETRRPLGQILLKGDNVSLIQNVSG